MRSGRAAVLCLLLGFALRAQEFRATISGSVTDASGSAVPNVKVAATEVKTGTVSQATSDANGKYTIPFLLPGTYEVTAEASGFTTFKRSGVTLGSGDHPVIDVQMQVGAQSQTVSVTADVPLVNNSNASAGQTITTKQVEDLPVNGRTPLMLAQLSMGVIMESQPGLVHPFDNGGATSISIAGSKIQASEILMDGSPDTTWDQRVAFNPTMDTVQQVTVDIFDSDAVFGHTSAGTANQITKGGSNDLHGTLYEFNENNFTSANNYFSNAAGKPVPALHYNQYGLSVGGPVWVPKVYNGKNKLFFFFAFEGLKDNTPTPTLTTVPTAAERNGDFSQLLSLGSNYQIYNPYTGVQSGTTITRQPFKGNVITSGINPIAQAYLNLYPLPNTTGLANGEDNYFVNAPSIDNFNSQFGRLDYNLGNNDKIFFDFRHNYRDQNKNNLFGGGSTATGTLLDRENFGSTVDEVHTFGGSSVLDVRLNWTRMDEIHSEPSAGINPTALGFPAYMASQSEHVQLPAIAFPNSGSGGFQSLGDTGASSLPSEVYQIFGTLEKVVGNHTIKAGGDARRYVLSNIAYGAAAGTFTFSTNWTTGPTSSASAAPIGQDLAAFLLGLPTSGSYNEASYAYLREYYYGLFFQDDWRVKSNLTLNLGLRMERETGMTERYGRLVSGFDTSDPNPLAPAAQSAFATNYSTYQKDCASFPAYCPSSSFPVNGGLTFASPSDPYAYHATSYHFSPRFGFSWSPKRFNDKTVIRGGFGIFVAPVWSTGLANINNSGTISSTPIVNQEGFTQSTTFPIPSTFLTPTTTLSNPFPTGILSPAPASSLGLGTFVGQNVSFLAPNIKNPYSERWEFDIQQQLSPNLIFEVGYIGNRGIHVPIPQQELNFLPRQYLSTSNYRDAADNAVNTALTASVPNPFKGLNPNGTINGSTVNLIQLLVPYPEFPAVANGGSLSGGINGVLMQNNTEGSSWFNSLNARIEKRYSSGLSLIGNYAYSKFMERDDYLNDSDFGPETRVSPFDHPHHIAVGFSYDFPIGKGKALDLHNGILNAVLGGWVTNGIYLWQIGAPIVFTANVVYCPAPSAACNGFGGPIDLNSSNGNGQAFNLQAFDLKSTDQPVDNIRTFSTTFGDLRQQDQNEFDASLLKNFNITESKYFQLRFEVYNVFNHPVFAAPTVSSPTSSTFGLIQSQANLPRAVQLGARFVF